VFRANNYSVWGTFVRNKALRPLTEAVYFAAKCSSLYMSVICLLTFQINSKVQCVDRRFIFVLTALPA